MIDVQDGSATAKELYSNVPGLIIRK